MEPAIINSILLNFQEVAETRSLERMIDFIAGFKPNKEYNKLFAVEFCDIAANYIPEKYSLNDYTVAKLSIKNFLLFLKIVQLRAKIERKGCEVIYPKPDVNSRHMESGLISFRWLCGLPHTEENSLSTPNEMDVTCPDCIRVLWAGLHSGFKDTPITPVESRYKELNLILEERKAEENQINMSKEAEQTSCEINLDQFYERKYVTKAYKAYGNNQTPYTNEVDATADGFLNKFTELCGRFGINEALAEKLWSDDKAREELVYLAKDWILFCDTIKTMNQR